MSSTPNPSETQRCGSCKQFVPLAGFSPSYRGKTGTWCRECFAAYNRGEIKTVEHEPTACSWCGATFTPKSLKSNSGSFCSRKCKDYARNRARQDEINATKPDRTCAWCGDALPQTMRADAKFCSADCNSAAHRTTRKFRRRLDSKAPRRSSDEPLINFNDIAERDKWRCGLCGGKVSKVREHPDPLAASIDHILPLSLGGDNEPANLQLSHLRCNLSKRDSARGEQMRLI